MILQNEIAEIVPEGLDQKTDALHRLPGKLERAINVEIDKVGELRLRRGYGRQLTGTPIGQPAGLDVDQVYLGAAVHDDELLALGYDYLYALGSRGSTLGGQRRFVYRGPTNRGQIRMQHVAVSSMTDEANYTDSSAGGIAFAGYEQGDVAALVTDGHLYRCNVWNDVGRKPVCFP